MTELEQKIFDELMAMTGCTGTADSDWNVFRLREVAKTLATLAFEYYREDLGR